MDVRRLVDYCEKQIGWKLAPVCKSFKDDFETFRNDVQFDELKDKNEIEKFIEICDNRIEHAKIFLSDIATVLGFLITGLALVIAVGSIKINEGDILPDPGLRVVISHGIDLTIFAALLISGIIILFAFLIRYEARIHAWTAFKEAAILNKP